MRMKRFLCFACVATAALVLFGGRPAQARPIEVDEGMWRLELQGAAALHSKKTDREGDSFLTGSVEYEMPTAIPRLTVGLRGYPLFVYRDEDHTILGAAAGFTLRLYQHPDTKDGLYAEAGSALLWHSRHFDGNSTRVNFLSELGFGYKFPDNPWNISLKYQHISNASTGNDNAGVNAVSLGFGYRF